MDDTLAVQPSSAEEAPQHGGLQPEAGMHAAEPEQATGEAAAGSQALSSDDQLGLDEEEPSLQLPPGAPEEEPGAPEALEFAALPSGTYASDMGDTIDFPSSRNSPDMPGSSSMYVTRWDPLGSRPQSPHSEQSFHSSIYPGGSTRTSTAGGLEPRSLVRSNERKSGLSTGDVITLSHQGRPYVAVQARLPYKNDQLHYCLDLAPDGVAPESEGLAYLEVIRQGPFLGFRSGAAGNRLLQPRRKQPHRLVFFNLNLGVWEQWEALGEEWSAAPWSSLPLVFRSRRMPHIHLEVEVTRVGHYMSAAPASVAPGAAPFAPTPRSLLPVIPEDSQVEDTNLRRISNVLVLEWFKFVDHEKVLREVLEAEVATLREEDNQFRLSTIGQVEFLRAHMNEMFAKFSAQLAARDDMLALFKAWLRHTQQVAADLMARQRHRRIVLAWRCVVDNMVYDKAAVARLRRKHQEALRHRAFAAWLGHTRGVAGAASKLFVAVQRRSHAIMSRVLMGWRQALAHRAWRGRVLVCAVQRRAARLLATAFAAWRQDAVQRAAGRAALLRALQAVQLAGLPAAMTAWRAAVEASRRNAVQAELLAARRATRLAAAAFAGWRSSARLSIVITQYARDALSRRALSGWRTTASAAQRRRLAADAMSCAWCSAQRRSVLSAWQAYASSRVSLRRRLEGHVVARSRASMAHALAAWARAARQQRRQRVLLDRHLAVVGARTAAAALACWRALAVRTAWRRSRLEAALLRSTNRRMTVALLGWHYVTVKRRATSGRLALVQARLRRMRLAAAFTTWRRTTVRARAARQSAEGLSKRVQVANLSAAFKEWRLLSRTATASRSAAARALPASTRALLTRLLGVWWVRHCAAPLGLASSPTGLRAAPVSAHAGPRATAAAEQAGQGLQAAESLARRAAQPQPQQEATMHTARATVPHAAGPLVQLGPSRGGPHPSLPEAQLLQGAAAPGASPASPAAGAQRALALATGAVTSPPRASAGNSPARPPLPPSASASPASSPGRTPRRTRESSGGSAVGVSPTAAGHTTLTVTSPIRSGRSYREALVAGAAAAAAAAAAGLSGSPTPSGGAAVVTPGGSAAGSRSSSVGRMRVSGSGMAVPFVPANTAIIGAGSCPVLIEMAPGRGGEGPLTPIGLPELLDGDEAGGEDAAASDQEAAAAEPPASSFRGVALAASFDAVAAAPYTSWQVLVSGSGLGRWLAGEVLRSWRRAAAARRSWSALRDRVVAARQRRIKGHVLESLRASAAAAKRLAVSAEAFAVKILARSTRQSQREVLAVWHEVARRRVAARALAARHVARALLSTSRSVLVEWRLVAAYKRACANKVQRMASRRLHACMARVFLAWHSEAADGSARRTAAAQLASHHTRDLLSSALHGWCGAAEQRRARAVRGVRAARHAQRRQLQGAFSRWRWAAEAATERAVTAVRAGREAALRAAFSGWLQAASDTHGSGPVDLVTAMQRAATWHTRRVLRACLAAFAEHCEERQLLQRQAEAIRQRVDAAAQASVLAHWRAEAAAARRAGVEVLKMQARSCRRRLVAAFQAWYGLVELMRGARTTADVLHARAGRSTLADVLAGWHAAARAAAESRVRLMACSKRIQRGCLERVFMAWHEAVAQRRARKSRMLLAGRRVEGVLLSHVLANWAATTAHCRAARAEADCRFYAHARACLRAAFLGWAELVPRLRAARQVAASRGACHDRALLREVLAGWLEAVHQARVRAEAAAGMAARRAAAALPASLRAWADVACGGGARRLQRAAVGHLVLRRCMALMRRAFRAWRGALEERRAREDELRRCIKRKKLAFGLFKQWYWEAFDADVQATIRRMFHSTDPAAHSPEPSLHPRFTAGQPQPYAQQQPFAYGRLGTAPGAEWQPSGPVGLGAGDWRGSSYGGAVSNGGSRVTTASTARPVMDVVKGAVGPMERPGQPRLQPVAAHGVGADPAQRLKQPQQPQAQQPRKPAAQVEPVRALAPAFDALAAAVPGPNQQRSRIPAATTPLVPEQAATAGAPRGQAIAGAAAAKAAAPSSRLATVRSAYSKLLHSDSDSDSDGDARKAVRAVQPAAKAAAMQHAASFGAWAGRKEAGAATAAAGRPSTAAAAGAFAAAAAAAKPRISAVTAPSFDSSSTVQRVYGPAAAAAVATAATEPPVAPSHSLEAVTAMNAVLVNVANQLTEVSRASLEIAAGVVANSNTGGAAGSGRPLLSASASVGSGAAYFPHRVSVDGSYGSGRSGGQHRGSPPGGVTRPGSAAAAAALSPLSPAPALAVYGATYEYSATSVASDPRSSGHRLPGVVPTWRQVANNTLFDEDGEQYGDDLGPVDPSYVGIARVGGADDTEDDGSVGEFAGAGSRGSVKSLGAASAGVAAGHPEQPGPFPLHNTHYNDVFRRRTDEEDGGEEAEGVDSDA